MPLSIIGPTVAIAINFPLAVWALLKEPRNASYRTFALFAFSLVIWNLGGQVFYRGGVESYWLRLSFVGMALVPANFLSLTLAAREDSRFGIGWQVLLYLPPLGLGLFLNPNAAAQAVSPAWRSGFYRLGVPEAMAFGVMIFIYLAAASWAAWRNSRAPREDAEWPFYLVMFPLVVGIVCVLAAAYLRKDKSPTVSLWAMAMSQYAMFMMIRHKLVSLELDLTRGIILAFSAFILAGCVLLGIALLGALFGRTVSHEMSLILVVSAVSLCVLYAAVLPRLEEVLDKFFARNRPPE